MVWVASNNSPKENSAKVLLAFHNKGQKTKQESDQAVFKHKIPISDQHKSSFANFLIID